MKILRSVSSEKAFYFYRSMGGPTGVAARSLPEFQVILRDIDNASLEFHNERGDFEKWVKMLGDDILAAQLAGLREKKPREGQLRERLVNTVGIRLNQLQKSSSR